MDNSRQLIFLSGKEAETQIIPARPGEASHLFEASDPISVEIRNILTAGEIAALDRGETVSVAHQRFYDYRARQQSAP